MRIPAIRLGQVLLLLAVLLGAPAAHAEGIGTISGKVVNATEGGGSVADLEVQLHTLTHYSGQEAGSPATTRADTEGGFSFSGLDTTAQNGYVVSVEFQGITYTSDVVIFGSDEIAKTAELKVYEPTSGSGAVQLRQQHLVIEVESGQKILKVLDISIIQNSGDTAFVGKAEGTPIGTFRLVLPAGARDVELGAGMQGSTVEIPGGLLYTAPILPGQTELIYSYLLDYRGARLALTKTLSMPAGGVEVLIADRGTKVTSAQLAAQPIVDLEGQKYLRLAAKNVAADTPLSVQFSDLPGAGSPLDPSRWLPPAGLALFVGATTYFIVSRRRHGGGLVPTPVQAAAPRDAGDVRLDDDDDEPELDDDLVDD